MYYLLGGIERVKESHDQLKLIREFTQEEHATYVENSKYLALHLKNKHLYHIIKRNGEELENYLETVKNDESMQFENPSHIIFETNRFLMNYLTMIRTYLDFIPSSLSKTFDTQTKEEFNLFLNKIYDDFFEYRFIYRLRNYAQHVDFPAATLTRNSEGSHVTMKRDLLLQYDGWSTVKKEVEKLDKDIEITGLAHKMNSIMELVYFFVMQLYAEGFISSLRWIESLQKEIGKKEPMLASSITAEEFNSGNYNLHPMNIGEFIRSIPDLNEHPNIEININ